MGDRGIDNKWCVISGGPIDGMVIWGPFDTMDDANGFAEHTDFDDSWWIVEMQDEDNTLDEWELKAKRLGVEHIVSANEPVRYAFYKKGSNIQGVPYLQYTVEYSGPTGNLWNIFKIIDGLKIHHNSSMGLWEALDLAVVLVAEES
jgi:hypothetical protein